MQVCAALLPGAWTGWEVTHVIEVEGKLVYDDLEEMVDPRHTAVLVVDMQNDFIKPGFAWDNYGINIAMYPAMISRLARLLEAAREARSMVVYIQMTILPGRIIESPAQLRFLRRLHLDLAGEESPLLYTVEGSPGQQIIDDIAPQPGDVVIKKYRSSSFWGTNLDMLLRSNKIETLIMSGCTTEGCVESTARDGLFNDYYVVVAEDCVASDDLEQHEASLVLMRHRFDMVTSHDLVGWWRSAAGVSAPDAVVAGERS
jgi:nicotinamidase-related amidase